jgi:hypothetical protein
VEYWGLENIAKRMHISVPTLRKRYVREAFLMFIAFPPRSRPGAMRWRWYTNDSLIAIWEVARCGQDRARYLARRGKTS